MLGKVTYGLFQKTIFQYTIRVPNSLNQDQDKRKVVHARTQMRGMGMGPRPSLENCTFYNFYLKQAIGYATPRKKLDPLETWKMIVFIEIQTIWTISKGLEYEKKTLFEFFFQLDLDTLHPPTVTKFDSCWVSSWSKLYTEVISRRH